MKKYIFSLFALCFSFLFLAGCNSAQTPLSPIQLQVTTAIEPEYDNIQILGNFVIAEKGDKSAIYSYNGTTYQLIAPFGTYVTEPNFSNCSTGNTLSVYTEEYDDNGNVIIKNGLIDLQGNMVVPLQNIYKCGILQTLDSNSSTFYIQNNTDTKITYFYDDNGNRISKLPNSTSENALIAQKGELFVTYFSSIIYDNNRTANLFDKNGNKILPVGYKHLTLFGDYFIAQSLDGLCGVIDWDGNIIVPFEYKSIINAHDTETKFKNSHWLEIKEQGSDECYLLNISTGETFLKNCGYTDLTVSVNDLVIAKKDGKTKIITLENQVLLEPPTNVVSLMEYNDTVYGYYKNKEGLDDGSVTVFDHNFNTVVVAQDWGSFWNYRDYGIYIFQNDSGNMGAYDYDGNIVVPFKYQSVKALNSTHYVVQQHNQYYLFDSQSQSIVSQPYDSVYFNQELVIAEKNGKQSFFNHNCEPIHLSGDSITTLVDTADEDTHYLDNQDGSKSIVIPTISDSGKKGAVLVSSFQ